MGQDDWFAGVRSICRDNQAEVSAKIMLLNCALTRKKGMHKTWESLMDNTRLDACLHFTDEELRLTEPN